MDIILTDIQARRIQRMARQANPSLKLVRRAGQPSQSGVCPRETLDGVVRPVLESAHIVFPIEELHVRVFGHGSQTRVPGLMLHRTTATLPSGSFDVVVLNDAHLREALFREEIRLVVDGPALCVLNTIGEGLEKTKAGSINNTILPFAWGLAMASELCGVYARNPFNPRRERPNYDATPVLTPDELRTFADTIRGVKGSKALSDVANYVSDLHGSPMEVVIYALAVVRANLGGLSLPRPITNKPLDLNARQLELISHEQITPDNYWEDYDLASEYDGSDHYTSQGIREDKRRVVDYQTLGITVLPATDTNFKDTASADEYMRTLARHMERRDGKTLTHRMNRLFRDPKHRTKRTLLRTSILSCP